MNNTFLFLRKFGNRPQFQPRSLLHDPGVLLKRQYLVTIIRQFSEISNIFLTKKAARPKLALSVETIEIGIYGAKLLLARPLT